MRLIQKALTFDDVMLLPAHSDILPANTSLRTRLTRDIWLNIPLLSAAACRAACTSWKALASAAFSSSRPRSKC